MICHKDTEDPQGKKREIKNPISSEKSNNSALKITHHLNVEIRRLHKIERDRQTDKQTDKEERENRGNKKICDLTGRQLNFRTFNFRQCRANLPSDDLAFQYY